MKPVILVENLNKQYRRGTKLSYKNFLIVCMNSMSSRIKGFLKDEYYPVAERIAKQGLYLPSGLTLTLEQIQNVCNHIKKSLESK